MAFLRGNRANTQTQRNSAADCVEANPRLVMAVMAIGVIAGALLSPSTGSSATAKAENTKPNAVASTR